MTLRIMYDSVNVTRIPRTADLAAVYFNGKFACTDYEFTAHFGSLKKRVLIDCFGDAEGCDVLDVENGDATPSTAARWVADKNRRGETGTVYCARDTIPAVWAACQGHSYYLWVATLDGTASWNGKPLSEVSGVVAVQYAGALQTGNGCDASMVYSESWPSPPPAPVPAPVRRITGVTVRFSDGSQQVVGS